MHRAEICHVLESLEPVDDIQDATDEPPCRGNLNKDQAVWSKPLDRLLHCRSGFLEVLQDGTKRDEVKRRGAIARVLDGGELQPSRVNAPFDRLVPKRSRWLKPKCLK